MVVHCGECGHRFDLTVELETPDTESVLAALREAGATDIPKCPRRGSVYRSGTLSTDPHPRLARAARAEAQATARKGDPFIRFAVGSPEAGRSAVWRLWVRRSDVYIAGRYLGGDLKVSLHEAREHWRFAFTREHMQRPEPLVGDRLIDKWEQPREFAPGWTKAFVIFVPSSEIQRPDLDLVNPDEVVWIPPPEPGNAVQFTVLLSAPGATAAPRGYPTAEGQVDSTEVVTVLPLENGERVWVLAHEEPMSPMMLKQLEQVRDFASTQGGEAVEAAKAANPNFDARLMVFGNFEDGLRFYLDAVFPTAD